MKRLNDVVAVIGSAPSRPTLCRPRWCGPRATPDARSEPSSGDTSSIAGKATFQVRCHLKNRHRVMPIRRDQRRARSPSMSSKRAIEESSRSASDATRITSARWSPTSRSSMTRRSINSVRASHAGSGRVAIHLSRSMSPLRSPRSTRSLAHHIEATDRSSARAPGHWRRRGRGRAPRRRGQRAALAPRSPAALLGPRQEGRSKASGRQMRHLSAPGGERRETRARAIAAPATQGSAAITRIGAARRPAVPITRPGSPASPPRTRARRPRRAP